MLHINITFIFTLLIPLIIIKIIFEQSHLLSFVILVEIASLFMIMFSALFLGSSIYRSAFIALILVSLRVCETGLALSLLVSNIRSIGTDKLNLSNLN